ncbi:MAG TPA: DEAD/DEAH box helicase, partial [Candidatus Dormibacteraeota bacterium]|nr:DEAD/DEAH box helicase [Candidatus Dormibacteraeota bacterium]
AFLREVSTAEPEVARARALAAGLDEWGTNNLLAYLAEQREATGAVPDDRTVVVERFRDQLGDWRVCVLTPFGARVHAPWALAATARLHERLGVDVQAIHSDDGFALRLPDVDHPPPVEELILDPDEATELVTAALGPSALFAARFRENAARALLLPRRRPGERTPLWKQRQRSHDLLQVAARHPSFPIIVETHRECLADVFDMNALTGLLRDLRSRRARVVTVDSERASPFAASLVFDWVAEFMYEGDQPLAERRAQALSLDRELLAELLGTEELRELLDPAAVSQVELELQGLAQTRPVRGPDDTHDLLRRLGDLSAAEAAGRGAGPDWLAALEAERRAVAVRIAGETRWIAAEDAGRYRDALGVALPTGLAGAHVEGGADPLGDLLRRHARTHVPFAAAEPARRWGLGVPAVEAALRRLAQTDGLLCGAFLAAGGSSEWCHPEVLRSLRRRSLAALRRQVEPVPVETLAAFLPAWQAVGTGRAGLEQLLEVAGALQGAVVPASTLERDVLSARVRDYQPRLLDELISLGELVWVGRGPLGSGDGRVALYRRDDAARLVPEPADPPDGRLHALLREELGRRGASFFHDLHRACGGGDPEELTDALWDMVWAGEVTNDSAAPLRLLGPRPRRGNPGRRPLMRLAPPRAQGRWSLVAGLREPAASPTERLHALSSTLLARHGVLTREAVLAEGAPGGFAGLYPVLRAMEEAGRVRRGYFVDGLGASQFALPGAVDRLRGVREEAGGTVVLAATDPASAYGATVPWPALAGRAARAAGAYVVLDSGRLRLYLERGGRSLLTSGEPGPGALAALASLGARLGRLELLTVDGEPVHGSALEPALREAGFGPSPRGMVLWGAPARRLPVGA